MVERYRARGRGCVHEFERRRGRFPRCPLVSAVRGRRSRVPARIAGDCSVHRRYTAYTTACQYDAQPNGRATARFTTSRGNDSELRGAIRGRRATVSLSVCDWSVASDVNHPSAFLLLRTKPKPMFELGSTPKRFYRAQLSGVWNIYFSSRCSGSFSFTRRTSTASCIGPGAAGEAWLHDADR